MRDGQCLAHAAEANLLMRDHARHAQAVHADAVEIGPARTVGFERRRRRSIE